MKLPLLFAAAKQDTPARAQKTSDTRRSDRRGGEERSLLTFDRPRLSTDVEVCSLSNIARTASHAHFYRALLRGQNHAGGRAGSV
jgi:hypothetical protein